MTTKKAYCAALACTHPPVGVEALVFCNQILRRFVGESMRNVGYPMTGESARPRFQPKHAIRKPSAIVRSWPRCRPGREPDRDSLFEVQVHFKHRAQSSSGKAPVPLLLSRRLPGIGQKARRDLPHPGPVPSAMQRLVGLTPSELARRAAFSQRRMRMYLIDVNCIAYRQPAVIHGRDGTDRYDAPTRTTRSIWTSTFP